MIVIAIEGGLVQSVSSDDPDLVGKAAMIIDYDAEGADPDEVERVPQGRGRTADATISSHEVGMLYRPVARFLKAKALDGRTGSPSTYERGDIVMSPFGQATIETDPDERGLCRIRVAAFDEKENPVSATTLQFGRIVRKWNVKGKPEEKKP
jgi:hypothetical protein